MGPEEEGQTPKRVVYKKADPITDPPILIVWYTSKLYSSD